MPSNRPSTKVNYAPSQISLPGSVMTHATSAAAHANLQSPENKKAVAFSLGTAVAEQIVKSRQYNYATSSIEGEGQTVSEIFSYKQNLRKIVPKPSPMQTVEEQPKVVAAKIIEPAYQVRNKGTDRISRLLSTEMEEEETPRYVSVRWGFMFFYRFLMLYSLKSIWS